MEVQGALQQSLDGKKGTSESFDSAQLNDFYDSVFQSRTVRGKNDCRW